MIDMSGVVARALAILQQWTFLRLEFKVKTIVEFNFSSQKIQFYVEKCVSPPFYTRLMGLAYAGTSRDTNKLHIL